MCRHQHASLLCSHEPQHRHLTATKAKKLAAELNVDLSTCGQSGGLCDTALCPSEATDCSDGEYCNSMLGDLTYSEKLERSIGFCRPIDDPDCGELGSACCMPGNYSASGNRTAFLSDRAPFCWEDDVYCHMHQVRWQRHARMPEGAALPCSPVGQSSTAPPPKPQVNTSLNETESECQKAPRIPEDCGGVGGACCPNLDRLRTDKVGLLSPLPCHVRGWRVAQHSILASAQEP